MTNIVYGRFCTTCVTLFQFVLLTGPSGYSWLAGCSFDVFLLFLILMLQFSPPLSLFSYFSSKLGGVEKKVVFISLPLMCVLCCQHAQDIPSILNIFHGNKLHIGKNVVHVVTG